MERDIADELTARLASEPDIDAAWLVGSRAREQARHDSDVDVAVRFGATVDDERAPFGRGRLMDELSGTLHQDVDVLDVARIPPVTFAMIMKDASLLLDRDPSRRIDVMARRYAFWHDRQGHCALQREAVQACFLRRKV